MHIIIKLCNSQQAMDSYGMFRLYKKHNANYTAHVQTLTSHNTVC